MCWLLLIKVKLLSINKFHLLHFPGDPSSDRGSHGAEDEPTAIEPAEYAARSPAAQQAFASKYPRVSLVRRNWVINDRKAVKPVNQNRKQAETMRREGRDGLYRSVEK